MKVIFVDQDNQIVGSGTAEEAAERGLWVRISRVILKNSMGEILLQKRSPTISSWPNTWDNSAAGHVDEGEITIDAAYRELKEEMGITEVNLKEASSYSTEENDGVRTRKRINVIFTGVYDGPVQIDMEEVSDYRWIKPNLLAAELKNNPSSFTKGSMIGFKKYLEA